MYSILRASELNHFFYLSNIYMVYYFTFTINNKVQYRTQVESFQCIDHTKKGARCKRRCVIGSPFCSTHLAFKHHLKVKTSNIPDSGNGLFAIDPMNSDQDEILFKKGETICKYYGEIINHNDLIERYSNKTPTYVIGISKDRYEDGAKFRGIGTLANTLPGHNNVTISIHRGHASLKATRNIRNGQEIYLSYGREYRINQPDVIATTTNK